MNKKIKIFSMILVLIILLITGCAKKTIVDEKVEQTKQDAFKQDIEITPSKIPPTQDEILYLTNGHQITKKLAVVIDQRCRESGLTGGDTSNGYGCV